jgi:hypothetical protein
MNLQQESTNNADGGDHAMTKPNRNVKEKTTMTAKSAKTELLGWLDDAAALVREARGVVETGGDADDFDGALGELGDEIGKLRHRLIQARNTTMTTR